MKFQRGPATVNGSKLQVMPLYVNVWEGAASNDHKPGDSPIAMHRISYEDRSGVADHYLLFYFQLV